MYVFPWKVTIVNKFLRLSACKTTQVVYLLDGGYTDICCHGFEHCFPGMERLRIPFEILRLALRQILSHESCDNLLVY